MAMRQFTLYMGLKDKDSKVQTIDTLETYKTVSKIMFANGIEGGTIFNAMGIYKHDNGEVITENTLRIEIIDFDDSLFENVKNLVNILKMTFNQESIAVTVQVINSELW